MPSNLFLTCAWSLVGLWRSWWPMNCAPSSTSCLLLPLYVWSCRDLKATVGALRTTGCTALGPALAVSTSMAAAHGGSAEVILCTDGMPNTGVGAVDGAGKGRDFYEKVSLCYLALLRHILFTLLCTCACCTVSLITLPRPWIVIVTYHTP